MHTKIPRLIITQFINDPQKKYSVIAQHVRELPKTLTTTTKAISTASEEREKLQFIVKRIDKQQNYNLLCNNNEIEHPNQHQITMHWTLIKVNNHINFHFDTFY